VGAPSKAQQHKGEVVKRACWRTVEVFDIAQERGAGNQVQDEMQSAQEVQIGTSGGGIPYSTFVSCRMLVATLDVHDFLGLRRIDN
jgi:hypothetical protein